MAKTTKEKSNGFMSIFDIIEKLSFDWMFKSNKKCCGGTKCAKDELTKSSKTKKKAKKK